MSYLYFISKILYIYLGRDFERKKGIEEKG